MFNRLFFSNIENCKSVSSQNDLFKLIFSCSNEVAIFIENFKKEKKQEITFASQSAKKLFLSSEDEKLEYSNFTITPEDKSQFLVRCELLSENVSSFDATIEYKEKIYIKKISATGISYNNNCGVLLIIKDLKGDKESEEKLEKELFLNTALKELSKELLQENLSITKISSIVNKYAKILTGSAYGYVGSIDKKTKELVIHTFSEMMDICKMEEKEFRFKKDDDGYPKLWGHSLNTGKGFFTNDIENHHKSGGLPQKHVRIDKFLSVPAKAKGEIIGQISVANPNDDYTDEDVKVIKQLADIYAVALTRKFSDKQLIEAKEKALESEKLKISFLANLSHEIRTPMNAVMGFANLLKEEDLTKEEQTQYVDLINVCSKQLLDIMNDIIDISKLETNQLLLESAPTDIVKALEELYLNYKKKIEESEKPIELVFFKNLTLRDSIVTIDVQRFQQIINHMLSNALKFTEEGNIELYVGKKNNFIEVKIKDTGIGMDEEEQKIIFDRFRQLDGDSNRKFAGTGIGLTISKKLIELLGGEIYVKSQKGKGSTFYITLPIVSSNK